MKFTDAIPCKRDCAERKRGCHGECQKYKEYAEEVAKQREERHINPADEYMVKYSIRGKERYRKQKKR